MNYKYFINKIVIQATGQCNLNCSYCYVPNRQLKRQIDIETIDKIVEYINKANNKLPIEIIWHCGEPLIIGVDYFTQILEKFKNLNVKHTIQTNAILINKKWCELFKKYDIGISVSIDGNEEHNNYRLDWGGKNAFASIVKKIELLKAYKLSFDIICVVHDLNVNFPETVFNFLENIGPTKIGFSIIEKEANYKGNNSIDSDAIINFWKHIFFRWKNNNKLKVREFDYILQKMSIEIGEYKSNRIELLPTIAYNGDVVILSPEFIDISSKKYNNFIIGNINSDSKFKIIKSILTSQYLLDFVEGIYKCSDSCDYFVLCGGGEASNKYFENNNLNSTETIHCLQSKKMVIDTFIENI